MYESRKKNKEVYVTLNSSLPIFWNFSLDKGRLKTFVTWFLKNHGEKKTLVLLEQLKTVGFGYATEAGISLGIEDLKIPPNKPELLAKSEVVVANSNLRYRKGDITGIEKMQQFIETWHETSETLKNEVVRYFEKTDILNPVYMMAFSGARGNLSQVRQLVGMRGLMADPQGKIIDFPIQSNFREGLTLTEYLISTYGARKGIVDTALRTATAGYLTRRLVDVAQHVIVSKFDCGTQRGIFLFDMKEGNKTIYSFSNRLTGRVLAQDIYSLPNTEKQLNNNQSTVKLATRNQEITAELAVAISKMTKKALVRSPLTCETRKLVCQLCYGWSLATSRLVSIGEAVGVIAGQSIGEPGTQLTMRTFHTGGVFAGGITEQINAPFSGIVEYSEPISGTCIRTPQGFLAFLTKTNGTLFLKKVDINSVDEKTLESNKPPFMNAYKIPAFTILFARHGEFIEQGKLLAQISELPIGQKSTQTIEQTIYSSLEGEVYYNQLDLLEDIDEKYGERISKAEDWSKVWVLSAKITKDPLVSDYLPNCGDFVKPNSIVNQIQWMTNSSQFSYIQAPSSTGSPYQNLDYSYQLKNPYKPISNLAHYGTILTKYKSQFKTNRNPKTNLKSEVQPLWRSTELKICSLYHVREKFSLNGVNFAYNKLKQQKTISTKLKKIETFFGYPYQVNLRFHFIKLLSQTFISLPILRSGVLTSWLNSSMLKYQKKKKENLNMLQPKDRNILVRKLNMNKKYRIYQENKGNYFHPLILSNFVPFLVGVNQKTIKNFFQRKTTLVNSDLENLRIYPYFNQHVRDFEETKMFSNQMQLKNHTVDLCLYRKCLENVTKNFLGKNQKLVPTVQTFAVNKFNSYFKHSSVKTKISLNPSVNKPKNLKMEQLSIKSPILFFNTKNVRYQKLGYLVSTSIKFMETDQFFSLLPLQGGCQTDSQKRTLVEDSSNPFRFTKILKENFENKPMNYNNSMNSVHLKNTDLWDSHSTQGFYWFPQFSQTLTNGISLISSPSLSQKRFQNKLAYHKVKNAKTTVLSTKKSIHFLNLAQSQIHKKQTLKKNSKKQKSSHKMQKTPFAHFANQPNGTNKNKELTKLMTHKNEIKPSTFPSFIKKKTVNYSLLKNMKHSQKSVLTLLRGQKVKTLSQLYSKYLCIQKSAMLNPKKMPQKELQKFNETKTPSFSKKDFKNVQSLIIKLNYVQKSSVPFHEIYWLPQENYLVQTFLTKHSLKKSALMQPGLISYQPKTNFLGKNNFTKYYLTNAQGFKKEMLFKYEGVLKLQKSKFLKSISKEQTFEKSFMDTNRKSLLFKEKTKQPVFSETFTMDLKNSHNFKATTPHLIQKNASLTRSYLYNFQHLTKELKTKFLTYILNKKNLKQPLFPYSKTDKSLNFLNFNRSFFFIKKQPKSFFSFLPFLRLKNQSFKITPEHFQLLKSASQKMDRHTMSPLTKQGLNLSIKPGWIYQTKNYVNLFKMHKTWVEPGKPLLDDLCFDQQKVFLEMIPVTKNIQTKKCYLHLKNKDGSSLFNASSKIQNNKSRFFPMETNLKAQRYTKATNLFFLIRPSTYSILPSLPQMKKSLYKAMKKTEMSNFQVSYFIYKKYYSSELNPQTQITKSLLSFAPMDIQMTWLNYFQSPSFSKKEKPVKIKTSKFKSKHKKAQKSTKKRVSSYLPESFLTKLLKTSKTLDSKEKIENSVRNIRKSKRVFRKTSEKMYFSHYAMNFLQLKIALSLPKSSLLAYSFPQVSLNTSQTSTYSANQIFSSLTNDLKNSYLTILMQRSLNKFVQNPEKNISQSKNNAQKCENSNHPISLNVFSKHLKSNLKKKKIVYLKSLVSVHNSMPCFEYSFHQKYAFFANQKLFASSFYQEQYENFLKITTLENNLFLTETLNGKRFIKKSSNRNTVAESVRFSLNSKNQLIFTNKYLNHKKPLGLTSFYSPYQGEVLKIYSLPRRLTDFQNLKKSVNIFLDTGLLDERQREKLILTKSDIYGVEFPTYKDLPIESKTSFPLVQTNSIDMGDDLGKTTFFNENTTKNAFTHLQLYHQRFQQLEKIYYEQLDLNPYSISNVTTYYQNKRYKIKNVNFSLMHNGNKLRLGDFINPGEKFYSTTTFLHSGYIIHLNSKKLTLRKAEFFCVSPQAILHTYNGHCLTKNSAVMTLPFQTLRTGDIVQGIPKVEQYLEARTTIRGRLFLNSLPVLLHAIFQRYSSQLNLEKAVRQSFLKIQQILVDGVQRVYRSQGVSIADKHLEVIVRQMTSKVKIVYGGQTGFFPGELVDLEFVERINRFLMVKIRYEPVVLGITRASLEVDSFLSAASFQQTTKILTRSAMENKRDFLKGLKENLLVGNLLPAGTGYVIPLSESNLF